MKKWTFETKILLFALLVLLFEILIIFIMCKVRGWI